MGYANPSQTSNGIHLRQFSRAFIIADADSLTRVVYVNTDSCMLSQAVKLEVSVYTILLWATDTLPGEVVMSKLILSSEAN